MATSRSPHKRIGSYWAPERVAGRACGWNESKHLLRLCAAMGMIVHLNKMFSIQRRLHLVPVVRGSALDSSYRGIDFVLACRASTRQRSSLRASTLQFLHVQQSSANAFSAHSALKTFRCIFPAATMEG
jgi:hypothetical protein